MFHTTMEVGFLLIIAGMLAWVGSGIQRHLIQNASLLGELRNLNREFERSNQYAKILRELRGLAQKLDENERSEA